MALEGRIGRLEDKATASGATKGIVADWAMEYVRENKVRLMEGRTGEIMRELGVNPALGTDEADAMRMARYLSETYPDLDACRRGEARNSEKVHALLAPAFKEESAL